MFHNHMKSLEKHPKKIHITSGAIKIMVPDWFLLDISPQNDNNSFELEGGEHVKTSLNAQSVFYNNFLSASMNYRTPSIINEPGGKKFYLKNSGLKMAEKSPG